MYFNTLAIATIATILTTITAAPLASNGGIDKRSAAPQATTTAPIAAITYLPVDNTWPKVPIHVDEVNYKGPGNIIKRQVDEDYEPTDDGYGPVDDGYSPPLDIIKYTLDEDYPRPIDEEYLVKRQFDDGKPVALDIIKYTVDERWTPPTDDLYPAKRQEGPVGEAHRSVNGEGTGPLPW